MDAGTLELVELDSALDFEHTPKCEIYDPCSADADLLEVNLCCQSACYSCAAHREAFDGWVAAYDTVICTHCFVENPDYEWRPIR